jgi:hypothetical protein
MADQQNAQNVIPPAVQPAVQPQQGVAPVNNQPGNVQVAHTQAVQGANGGINLKVKKAKLPKFWGQKDKDSIAAAEFAKRFNWIMSANGWTDEEAYHNFDMALRRSANIWLKSMVTLQKIRGAENYGPSSNHFEAYYEICDEAIGEFYLLNFFRAGLPTELKKVLNLQALNDLELYMAVKLATIESRSREEAKFSSRIYAIQDEQEDTVDVINYRPQWGQSQQQKRSNPPFLGNN